MTTITATRYHDFSAGHRVVGQTLDDGSPGPCCRLHGHNYRVHFTIEAHVLDGVGRVVDFSVIKDLLCEWLEDEWDHRFLVWEEDPMLMGLTQLDPEGTVVVPFNPTAENMGQHLIQVVGPQQLRGTGAWLKSVLIEETRKCSVEVSRNG